MAFLFRLNAEPAKLHPANPRNTLEASRIEAWKFIIEGGIYNQLSSQYTDHNEDASGTDNQRALNQLKVLNSFMKSFDFIKMKRNALFSCSTDSVKSNISAISEQGKQYAFYINHSKVPEDDSSSDQYYHPQPGKFKENLTFDIPKGTYRADWVDPAAGTLIRTEYFSVKRNKHKLSIPEYSVDIALRIIRIL